MSIQCCHELSTNCASKLSQGSKSNAALFSRKVYTTRTIIATGNDRVSQRHNFTQLLLFNTDLISDAPLFYHCRFTDLAFSKVADALLPIAPNPTPTASPSGMLCTWKRKKEIHFRQFTKFELLILFRFQVYHKNFSVKSF